MEFSFDFFDTLRRMKSRPQVQAPFPSESAREPAVPAPTIASGDADSLSLGPAGLALIKRFESCARKRSDGRFEAYPDPGTGGDPWTIGWGATGPDGPGGSIGPGTIWTRQQCDDRLDADLARFSGEVARAIGTAPTTQAQFDALVSFHYNTGAIAKAKLTRLHKAGDFVGAASEFGKWVHAGGKRLNGLVRRREAEARLYRGQ